MKRPRTSQENNASILGDGLAMVIRKRSLDMRILILSESTNLGGIGGGEIFMSHLLSTFSIHDYEILIFCDTKLKDFLIHRGISTNFENYVFDALMFSTNEIIRFFSILFSMGKIIKKTLKFKPDIIFTNIDIVVPSAYFLHKFTGVPIIFDKSSVHIGKDLSKLPSSSNIYALIEKFILKFFNFNLIISCGDFFLQIYKRLDGPSRCTIIPVPCDLNKFHPISEEQSNRYRRNLGIDIDTKVIVFIGRIVIEKGIMDLLRAFKIIIEREKDVILLLVGGGNIMDQVKNFIESNNLTPQIKIFGVIPNDKIPPLLQISDVFVLPSYNEVRPRTAIEAMACGKPVVGTLIPAFEDLYNYRKSLVLVPPKNPEALAEAINSLLSDRNRMKMLGKDNLKIAERHRTEFWSETIIGSFNSVIINT